jgi:hypothetical protein
MTKMIKRALGDERKRNRENKVNHVIAEENSRRNIQTLVSVALDLFANKIPVSAVLTDRMVAARNALSAHSPHARQPVGEVIYNILSVPALTLNKLWPVQIDNEIKGALVESGRVAFLVLGKYHPAGKRVFQDFNMRKLLYSFIGDPFRNNSTTLGPVSHVLHALRFLRNQDTVANLYHWRQLGRVFDQLLTGHWRLRDPRLRIVSIPASDCTETALRAYVERVYN